MKRNPRSLLTLERVSNPLPLFFLGLFVSGCGVFLLVSVATANFALDPGGFPWANGGYTPDPFSSAHLCATGLFGAWTAYGLVLTVGWPAGILTGILVVLWGWHILRDNVFFATWPRVLGGILTIAFSSLLSSLFFSSPDPTMRGFLSEVLGPPIRLYLGDMGYPLALGGALVFSCILTFGNVIVETAIQIGSACHSLSVAFADLSRYLANAFLTRLRPRLAAITTPSLERSSPSTQRLRGETRREDLSSRPLRPKKISGSEGHEKVESAREEERSHGEENGDESYDSSSDSSREPIFGSDTPFRKNALSSPEEDRLDRDLLSSPSLASTKSSANEGSFIGIASKTELEPEFMPYATAEEEKSPEQALSVPKTNRGTLPRNRLKDRKGDFEDDYVLPPLDLLDQVEEVGGENISSLEKRARTLEATLADFKIEGKVVHIERGPRVTQFEMTLAPGIKLSRVITLADNLAMSLKAPSVRIIAPIPGKDTIGIEIPNLEREIVTLRSIVETIDRNQRKERLPIALGKDVSGRAIVADLTKMPHLLIAGATGSGKSVCINSVILSFLMCCRPDECKLILIDPKVVELSRFKGIPHLMSPVITDMKRAVAVLEWACQKMDERYEQLSEVAVNNIAKFNELGAEEIERRLAPRYSPEEIELFPKHLPYVVIIIDELADLMMVAGKEVEQHITRLAAKSRAVGIHLILATQRPSVDVITGLIKANMPARIAFQVASKVDSRTILDQNGAETLLGAGDMLYLPPGVGKVMRVQGVFVSDEELFAVVNYCTAQRQPEYHADLEGPMIGGGHSLDVSEMDELFVQSGEAIIESGRGSVSLLQRKFGIGYGRASRIIDQLEAMGVLGPFREGKAREILMTMEEFRRRFSSPQTSFSFPEDESTEKEQEEVGAPAGLRPDERMWKQPPWEEES